MLNPALCADEKSHFPIRFCRVRTLSRDLSFGFGDVLFPVVADFDRDRQIPERSWVYDMDGRCIAGSSERRICRRRQGIAVVQGAT
jgi:hypothetical protein